MTQPNPNHSLEGPELLPDLEDMIHDRPDDARRILAAHDAEGAPVVHLYTWADLGKDPPPQPWVIPDWLPSGAVTIIEGPADVGKSWLGLELAAAVAGGNPTPWGSGKGAPRLDPALGGSPAPAVYASWEDSIAVTRRRLSLLSGSSRPWVRPDMPLYLATLDGGEGLTWAPPLWERGSGYGAVGSPTELAAAFWRAVQDVDAALVVIDSSAGVYADSENDRSSVRAFLRDLGKRAAEGERAILLIAHLNKAGQYSGSTDWRAGCRAMWLLEKGKRGRAPSRNQEDTRPEGLRLTLDKSNYLDGPKPPPLALDWQDGGLVVTGPWDDAGAADVGSNGREVGYDYTA